MPEASTPIPRKRSRFRLPAPVERLLPPWLVRMWGPSGLREPPSSAGVVRERGPGAMPPIDVRGPPLLLANGGSALILGIAIAGPHLPIEPLRDATWVYLVGIALAAAAYALLRTSVPRDVRSECAVYAVALAVLFFGATQGLGIPDFLVGPGIVGAGAVAAFFSLRPTPPVARRPTLMELGATVLLLLAMLWILVALVELVSNVAASMGG